MRNIGPLVDSVCSRDRAASRGPRSGPLVRCALPIVWVRTIILYDVFFPCYMQRCEVKHRLEVSTRAIIDTTGHRGPLSTAAACATPIKWINVTVKHTTTRRRKTQPQTSGPYGVMIICTVQKLIRSQYTFNFSEWRSLHVGKGGPYLHRARVFCFSIQYKYKKTF